MVGEPAKKLHYGKRKTNQQPSKQAAEEMDDFLNDSPSTSLAEWLEIIRLLFVIIFKLFNPLNWRNLYINLYRRWLRRTGRYQKVIEFWSKRTLPTNAGQIIKQLELTDCYIQLGEYTKAKNCLKGLSGKVDAAERDDEWKAEQYWKIKLYRKTIYGLAQIPLRKTKS